MRKMIISAITATAAAAVMGGAGLAAASTHSAVSGPENLQFMTTSATGNPSVIAHGSVFTAAGVDHENPKTNTGTLVFPNGSVTAKHSAGQGTQSFNRKTCLLTVNFHGTYQITGGTGAYAGITGSGKYQLHILAIGAKSGGKCTQSQPPVAFHQVINATGTASLP
jgi:hypothetical protein